MASNAFYLVHFSGNKAEWGLFDGAELVPAEPPRSKSAAPVLALIPDRFFFFYRPKEVAAKSEKAIRAAIRMQMQYNFPAPVDEQAIGVFKTPAGEMLGYVCHNRLVEFWAEHKELFERANVVSTPFILAWCAARAEGLEAWLWKENGGPRVLYAGETLHYAAPSGEELQQRLQELAPDTEPEELGWLRIISSLAQHNIKLAKLRIPLTQFGEEADVDPRRWAQVFVAVALIGLLFCAGELQRLLASQKRAEQWRTAVHEQLASVLGPDYGSDPYGKLLFRIDQLQGSQSQGLDVLDMLALISRAAPEDFKIASMTFNDTSGHFRAKLQDYAQLEQMMQKLQEQERYAFTLDQASNVSDGVQVVLRVEIE